jgi:hypothetical protein
VAREAETPEQTLERLQRAAQARTAAAHGSSGDQPPEAAPLGRLRSVFRINRYRPDAVVGVLVAIGVALIIAIWVQTPDIESGQPESCSHQANEWRQLHPGTWNGFLVSISEWSCENATNGDDAG